MEEEIIKLKSEIDRLRLDMVDCHYKRPILDSLYEAAMRLPACGTFAIICGAIQEIQALHDILKNNKISIN
jgi:hypothetical protein